MLVLGWGAVRWCLPATRTRWPFWLALAFVALPIEVLLRRHEDAHTRWQGLTRMAIAFITALAIVTAVAPVLHGIPYSTLPLH